MNDALSNQPNLAKVEDRILVTESAIRTDDEIKAARQASEERNAADKFAMKMKFGAAVVLSSLGLAGAHISLENYAHESAIKSEQLAPTVEHIHENMAAHFAGENAVAALEAQQASQQTEQPPK